MLYIAFSSVVNGFVSNACTIGGGELVRLHGLHTGREISGNCGGCDIASVVLDAGCFSVSVDLRPGGSWRVLHKAVRPGSQNGTM